MNTKLDNKLTPNPHTPTPWAISPVRTTEDTAMIVGGEGQDFGLIADVTEDCDAAFIVEAANNHAALVTALQDVLWACHHVEKWHSHIDATFADDTEWTDSAKDFKEKRKAAREALDRLTLRTEPGPLRPAGSADEFGVERVEE